MGWRNVIEDDIGGRDIDAPMQLCWALEHLLKEQYPINRVPPELVEKLELAKIRANEVVTLFKQIQRSVNEQFGKQET